MRKETRGQLRIVRWRLGKATISFAVTLIEIDPRASIWGSKLGFLAVWIWIASRLPGGAGIESWSQGGQQAGRFPSRSCSFWSRTGKVIAEAVLVPFQMCVRILIISGNEEAANQCIFNAPLFPTGNPNNKWGRKSSWLLSRVLKSGLLRPAVQPKGPDLYESFK